MAAAGPPSDRIRISSSQAFQRVPASSSSPGNHAGAGANHKDTATPSLPLPAPLVVKISFLLSVSLQYKKYQQQNAALEYVAQALAAPEMETFNDLISTLLRVSRRAEDMALRKQVCSH